MKKVKMPEHNVKLTRRMRASVSTALTRRMRAGVSTALTRILQVSILFLFSCFILHAQNNPADSLLALLKNEKTDNGKVNYYNKLFLEYEYTDNVKARYYIYKALRLSKEINYEKGLATTYKYLGIFADDTSNFQQAIIHFKQSLKISENIGDKKNISAMLGAIGFEYYFKGEYPKALEYYFKSLKIAEELGDKSRIAKQLGNIGIVYEEQSDYTRALDYYFKALKMAKALGDKSGIAADLGNLGNVYKKQANDAELQKAPIKSDSLYKNALDYYFKALKLAEGLDDKNSIATQFVNIGTVYHDLKDYQKALDYYFRALKMDEELGYKSGIANDLGNIGSLYISLKKYSEAEKYLLQAISISDSIGILKEKVQFENSISELYSQTGKVKEAFEHFKKAIEARDTLINEAKSREIMNYEFEKKEAAVKAEQDKKDALAAAESRKQEIIIWSVIGGLFLVALFAGFIFRSLRVTKKQKIIIEKQKHLVEEHQKEIIDSITYAHRIQRAILTSDSYIKHEINSIDAQHFILFKPKDIVSGDFYWFFKQDNCLYYITADCTGHGVPGGFMSMLGISFLNEIIIERHITDPGEILNKLREKIVKSLKTDEGYTKDGMDAILCKIDKSKQILQYAAANNSFYIIRNNEIIEQKAQKMPVGYMEDSAQFVTQTFRLQKGDNIYTFTDGLPDQFGGPKGKKFMYRRFEENLSAICNLPLKEQEETLEKTFQDWKGNLEQVDDVTVIGIRI